MKGRKFGNLVKLGKLYIGTKEFYSGLPERKIGKVCISTGDRNSNLYKKSRVRPGPVKERKFGNLVNCR